MEAHRLENLSIADYIQIEKETDTKYEYHDGKIFAMAGGTVEHVLISGNICGEIERSDREAKFSLAALGIELSLANIYENIDFPQAG